MSMNFTGEQKPETSGEYQEFMNDYVGEWQKKYKEYEEEMANPAELEEKLQRQYMEVLKEMDISGDLTEVWNNATNLEEQLVYGEYNNKYVFATNNQYSAVESPLDLAYELMNKGKNNEAILALEAALQKNQKDAQNWRLLGKLLQ